MGTRRIIHFYAYRDDPDDLDMEISFGTYVLMLYYAGQLNYQKAKLLYHATLSEYRYRINYDLPLGNLTDDDDGCHFDVTEFQQVIAFIENELIPELNKENQDLIEKYGGEDGFYNKFNQNSGFIEASIYDEYYDSDPWEVAAVLTAFKSLLSNAILTNRLYRCFIY